MDVVPKGPILPTLGKPRPFAVQTYLSWLHLPGKAKEAEVRRRLGAHYRFSHRLLQTWQSRVLVHQRVRHPVGVCALPEVAEPSRVRAMNVAMETAFTNRTDGVEQRRLLSSGGDESNPQRRGIGSRTPVYDYRRRLHLRLQYAVSKVR